MTSVTQALSSALLHFVWQGVAAGLLLGIALLVLRKNSPRSRYVASCAVLALLALAPLVTGWISYQSVSGGADSSFTISSGTLNSVGDTALSDNATPTSLKDFEGWILPLWATGVMAFALRLAWASGHASSLRRHGVAADSPTQSIVAGLAARAGIRRTVRVLMSSLAEVPSVVGWLRPVILLPVAVVGGLTPQQVEALIAHELAHIRRYDYLVNILQMVVETLFFYHPAVWWISSRIRYERELCCDDLAVRICGDAVGYARALTQLEKLRPSVPTLAMGAGGGPLLHRVQRLLGRARSENGPSKVACALGLLVGVLSLGLFMKSARAQQETPATPIAPPSEISIPLAPVAPVAPMPAVAGPVARAVTPQDPLSPPVPPPPPAPPAPPLSRVAPVALSPLPLLPPQPPLPPGVSLDDSHWVLFRGSDVVVHGSASDEAEARKARSSFTGDLLWFQLEGKSYVTQDTETLERVQSSNSGSRGTARVSQARAAYDNAVNSQRTTGSVQQLIEQLQEQLRKMDRALAPADLQQGLAEIQRQVEAVAAQNSRAQAELQMSKANLEAAEAARVNLRRSLDFLRNAVLTGKAQAAP